jgi:hypothetical protein
MNPEFSTAFEDGLVLETFAGLATLKVVCLGELVVPTGYIVACDPFVCSYAAPFTFKVPCGSHPVELSIAAFANNDQRVAFARIRFRDSRSFRWEMALVGDQDPTKLEEGYFFGYPVDSGTGCFMDAESARAFNKCLENEEFVNFMMSEMEKTYVSTWDWASFTFDQTSGNLFTFHSGLGDGSYPSYFGFDENDQVTELITDFIVCDP